MGTPASLPGDSTPGREVPGMPTPGAETPGSDKDAEATVTIDVTNGNTTTIGTFDGSRVSAVEVEVTGNYTGYDFQVSLGGVDVFDASQSPSGADEVFAVDDPVDAVPSDKDVDGEVTVTDTSTAGSPANEDVTLRVHTEDV